MPCSIIAPPPRPQTRPGSGNGERPSTGRGSDRPTARSGAPDRAPSCRYPAVGVPWSGCCSDRFRIRDGLGAYCAVVGLRQRTSVGEGLDGVSVALLGISVRFGSTTTLGNASDRSWLGVAGPTMRRKIPGTPRSALTRCDRRVGRSFVGEREGFGSVKRVLLVWGSRIRRRG